MIRALAQRAGWLPEGVRLRHLGYGVVLQEINVDGQLKKVRFKTRAGGTVKLRALLDEGRQHCAVITRAGNPTLDGAELARIAQRLTIAALKYAELKQRPESDYTFNWDVMLANQGNTGIYLMYCYVRVLSLLNKSGQDPDQLLQDAAGITPAQGAERDLLLRLVAFPELFAGYEEELTSHNVCAYLYDLAVHYSRFWNDCPILGAEPRLRDSRLLLSLAVAQRLKLGLSLLGIDVLEKM